MPDSPAASRSSPESPVSPPPAWDHPEPLGRRLLWFDGERNVTIPEVRMPDPDDRKRDAPTSPPFTGEKGPLCHHGNTRASGCCDPHPGDETEACPNCGGGPLEQFMDDGSRLCPDCGAGGPDHDDAVADDGPERGSRRMADRPVCVTARVCEVINEVCDDDDAVTLAATLRDEGLLAAVCTSDVVARCFDCPCPRVTDSGRSSGDAGASDATHTPVGQSCGATPEHPERTEGDQQ